MLRDLWHLVINTITTAVALLTRCHNSMQQRLVSHRKVLPMTSWKRDGYDLQQMSTRPRLELEQLYILWWERFAQILPELWHKSPDSNNSWLQYLKQIILFRFGFDSFADLLWIWFASFADLIFDLEKKQTSWQRVQRLPALNWHFGIFLWLVSLKSSEKCFHQILYLFNN